MYVVFGWLFVAVGTTITVARLVKLRIRWPTAEMAEPGARSGAWAQVCLGALPVAVGLGIVGSQTNNLIAERAAWLGGLPLAGLAITLLAVSGRQGKHGLRWRRRE